MQRPLQQTSPSPWPSAFPLPLHPLDEEGGPIKRHIAIQMKTSYISVGLSLLSKGLRGGMSRSDRVVSLLRHMLQSVRSKRPHRTALLWTQVQRLPEQKSRIPPYIPGKWSLLSKGLRGGKSRRLRVVSLSRHMLQSVRSKSATKRSPSKKSIVGGKAPTPQGFNRGPAAARWCNIRRIRFLVSPVHIG